MVFIVPVVGQALVVFQEDSRKEERHTVQVGRRSWLGKETDQ